jgi:hypothetical protein
MAQALNGYANALISGPRRGQPILRRRRPRAIKVSAFRNPCAPRGEAYYRGDYKSARSSYQRALEAAQRAKSKGIITAQFSLARIQLQEGDSAGR